MQRIASGSRCVPATPAHPTLGSRPFLRARPPWPCTDVRLHTAARSFSCRARPKAEHRSCKAPSASSAASRRASSWSVRAARSSAVGLTCPPPSHSPTAARTWRPARLSASPLPRRGLSPAHKVRPGRLRAASDGSPTRCPGRPVVRVVGSRRGRARGTRFGAAEESDHRRGCVRASWRDRSRCPPTDARCAASLQRSLTMMLELLTPDERNEVAARVPLGTRRAARHVRR
jgi:hypothetical protein